MYSLEQKATAPTHAVPSPSVVLQRQCERLWTIAYLGSSAEVNLCSVEIGGRLDLGGKFLIDASDRDKSYRQNGNQLSWLHLHLFEFCF